MTLAVSVAAHGIRVPVAMRRVQQLAHSVLKAEGVREAMVSIAFLKDADIARLNRVHLAHTGPTDVISFAFTAPGTTRSAIVGDIYIAPDVARRNARAFGSGVREEILRLVVHGVLHVAGHDHPEGEGRMTSPMWKRQEQLLRRLGRKAA